MPDNNNKDEVIDDSEDEVIDYAYAITSYGADYPVDSLITRLRNENIFIPVFQRNYVWSLNQASRFIESLLLGLPVPGIFLSKEPETGKLLVIDGHQRLKSLQYFYDGIFLGKEFKLSGVQKRLENCTYKTLDPEDKLRLDDSIIHATIVKQDEPSDDESSIYHIFERLNTGGNLLHPQEIRACIYHGIFNELLSELNNIKEWQTIFGEPSKRMKDQELILRFFAFYFYIDRYKKPLKSFLNDYMSKNKNLKLQSNDILKSIFVKTVDFISKTLGKTAFRPKGIINASIFDSIMVGIAKRLNEGPIKDDKSFLETYNSLLEDTEYLAATSKGTSDEPVVEIRFSKAIKYFKNLK